MAPPFDQHSKLEVLLIDRIDQASLICLHDQLLYICGLLAASSPAKHLVLCVLTRTAKTDGQLKVRVCYKLNVMRCCLFGEEDGIQARDASVTDLQRARSCTSQEALRPRSS